MMDFVKFSVCSSLGVSNVKLSATSGLGAVSSTNPRHPEKPAELVSAHLLTWGTFLLVGTVVSTVDCQAGPVAVS